MSAKKETFHSVIGDIASAGTNYLETEPVDTGWLWCIQRMAAIDGTTAFTRLRFIIKGMGKDFLVNEQKSPQADELYWDDMPVYLREGQYLQAELTGCTAGDVINCYLTGWKKQGGQEG